MNLLRFCIVSLNFCHEIHLTLKEVWIFQHFGVDNFLKSTSKPEIASVKH